MRSSIWRRSHRAKNRADRHALSEHVFLVHMLWIEGFLSHTTCSIPGRNRVDRDFLQNRVSRDTECSNRMAGTGSDGCHGRMNRSVQADWLRCSRGRVGPTISHVSGNSKAPLNRSTPRASCTTPLKCAALVARRFSARPTPQFFC